MFYRALLTLFRAVTRLLRFELVLEGATNLPRTASGAPAGGWIAAALPHRTWVDPFALALLLPAEPRLVFLGDGRAIFRSPLRRLAFRLLGGVVPIWPGGSGRAFGAHVQAAQAVVNAGAVFALFPEVGPPVPVDEARPLGGGVGYFALRTDAPVVPLVLGGTDELYLGRRIILRVLPATTARELAGLAATDHLSDEGSPAERDAAHRIAAALHGLTARAVAETHAAAESPSGRRKRWCWLTGLFH